MAFRYYGPRQLNEQQQRPPADRCGDCALRGQDGTCRTQARTVSAGGWCAHHLRKREGD